MNIIRPTRLFPLLLSAGLLLGACEYSEVDGVGTRTADEENPPQLDLTSFDGCQRGELGQWRADATITNNTDVVSTYELTVSFYDGDVRLAERGTWVRDLKPGEAAKVDHGWWIDGADDVTRCEVLTINRFG